MAASPSTTRARRAPTAAPPALERHAGLTDPRRPASLLHAYIVVSLIAGVRPEEARAIGWEEDVDLDGDPPLVAVLRADRAGGDTKTPRSRRALQLAQMAVGALRSGRWTRRLAAAQKIRLCTIFTVDWLIVESAPNSQYARRGAMWLRCGDYGAALSCRSAHHRLSAW